MRSIKDKVVVITGASRGIGAGSLAYCDSKAILRV